MTGQLSKFQVLGLYGFKNFHVTLSDNALIIVGENGSGKTTLLRMLFYFLSGRWQSLVQFQFKSILGRIDNEIFTINREELVKAFSRRDHRFFASFPSVIRNRLRDMIAHGQIDRIPDELARMGPRYGIPSHVLERDFMNYMNDGLGLDEGVTASLKAVRDRMN